MVRRWVAGVAAVVMGSVGLTAAPAHAAVWYADTPTASWGVDGRVYATVIAGDTVVVGGSFRNAVSSTGAVVARKNLAAFSLSTGELLTGWVANAGAPVRALVSDGSSVWVGGGFSQIVRPRVGTTPGVTTAASRLAKLDVTTGRVDTAFRGSVDGTVRALALEDGRLYAGGLFRTANAEARNRLAEFDAASGTLDAAFRASADQEVWGLAAHPTQDVVYAAGRFAVLSGAARTGVGAVSGATGAALPVTFASAARPTLGLVVNEDGSRLFGAGGAGTNAAVAWDTTSGRRMWRQVAMGDVQAVAYHDGTVYFGFHEGYQEDTTLKLLAARADDDSGDLQSFYPRFDGFWGIFAIAATDAGLVAGGEFTQVAGVGARNLARFPGLDAPRPDPQLETYVDSNQVWRFWDDSSRPTGWQTLNFADGGWGSGIPQLGYGDGDESTVIRGGTPATRSVTAYFRTTFDVPAGGMPDALRLELLADDGAVVYLNGVQVVKDNLPDGAVAHTTLATTAREVPGVENALRPFSINPAQLRVGRNVLAVEVHQVSTTSTDLGLDAQLTGAFVG